MANPLAKTFILITVTLDSIGIGLIFPVMPDLLEEITGGTISSAAIWGGVLAAVFAAMQFTFGPILGSLSDRYGRRPVLLVALAVMSVDYLIMALADAMWLLLIGRLIAGITAATHATASAYMADISAPDDRARNFGLIGAGFGVGFVLGPVLGGFLAEFGTRAPFYAAAGMAALNLAFGALVLPESVTDRIRRPFLWRAAHPLASFRSIGALPGLPQLLLLFLIYSIAMHVYPAVWAYYGKARFDWDARMIGISLAIFGTGMALVQAFLIAPAIRVWGEHRTALYGMLLDTGALIVYGFIVSGVVALVLTPVAALGGIVGPAITAIMSRRVPDNRQGELQGVIASIAAVSMAASPLLMNGTFGYFTRQSSAVYAPGAPFLLAAVLMFVCLAIHMARPRRPA